MSNNKVLITGGTGFLGSQLLEIMKGNNYEITLLLNQESNRYNKSLTYNCIEELFKIEDHFDIIFHLAGFIPYGEFDKPNQELTRTNILLTAKLSLRYPDAKFILASSVSVYGENSDLPLKISSNFVKPTLYGKSKLAAEAIVQNHNKYSIIRFSSLIGPNMKPVSFVPRCIKQAKENNIITIWGDGARKQNYLDVRDAARLILHAAYYLENEIILGIANNSVSNEQIVNLINLYHPSIIKYTGKDESTSFIYDDEDTYKKIDFTLNYSISKTLKDMIE
jgi:UDP-glucose 4-epimerase